MKFFFLLVACFAALTARALDVPDDLVISAPYQRTDAVRVQGTLTLSTPGEYSAADWSVYGSVRFSATGTYTFTATIGGVYIAGNLLASATKSVTVTIGYATTFAFRGTTPPTVTVIDGPHSPPPPQPGVAATAPLLNISTRVTLVGPSLLNPGFVIGGTTERRVLVRAIGPGLAAFDVTNPARTPTLKVYSGSTQIAENSAWGGDVSLAAVMAAVGAFALDPSSNDAVLLLTLPPGNYTATISGPGDVLFEVYFVD